MEGKHVIWLTFIVALAIILLALISAKNKPVLTDPIAQRIWASTNGSVGYTAQEVENIIKEANKTTNGDSVVKDKKK